MRKETLKQKEAFEYYYQLGDTRTLKKVAQKYHVSLVTVKSWSARFLWKARIHERELRLAEQLQKKIENRIVKNREEYLKILEAAKIKFVENLKNGFVDPITIQDLERLIKLELQILSDNKDFKDRHITVISAVPRPSS